jgi:hypothetical protein
MSSGDARNGQGSDLGHDQSVSEKALEVEEVQISTVDGTTTVSSDNPLYVQGLSYTKEEERAVVKILDTRLFPWVLLTTFVLNMDRTNLSNAISDNLPQDLGFTIDTVNLATAIYAVLFSLACFSGAVMAKIVGPARCESTSPAEGVFLPIACMTFTVTLGIPILMFSWGLVTMAHALIKDRGGYLTGEPSSAILPDLVIHTGLHAHSTMQ